MLDMDQLVFASRYVYSNGERFLMFISNIGHKSTELMNAVVQTLSDFKIPIEDCRGQTYDNATNMSGSYTGLQAKIEEINPNPEFIPCAGHSLNLVRTNAVDNCTYSLYFFDLLQKLYNFFACTTNRWLILEEHIGKGKVVKSLWNKM